MDLMKSLMDNYALLFELVGLFIVLRISAHVSVRAKRLTEAVVILMIVTTVVFELELWTQSFATLSLLRPMLTALKYSLFPIITILLTQITAGNRLKKKRLLLLLLPEIVSVPLYFSSQWTHLVCWFEPDNAFTGGPLRYLPYVVFGFYCAVFLAMNVLYFHKYSLTSRIMIVFITVGSILGVVLYVLTDFSDNYCGLFTSAVLLYYLCLYIHLARIDPLTGLLNRQSFYQQIKQHPDRYTGVVSVDMNDLKEINDSRGHEAGDRALKHVARCLMENSGTFGTAYRIGGDEFVILYAGLSEEEFQTAVEMLRVAMALTPFDCAFGGAYRGRETPITDALRQADQAMYRDKVRIKTLN